MKNYNNKTKQKQKRSKKQASKRGFKHIRGLSRGEEKTFGISSAEYKARQRGK